MVVRDGRSGSSPLSIRLPVNNHVESTVYAKPAIPFIDVCHIQTSGQMEAITYTNLHAKNMLCCKKQELNVG